ncbi:hypothetical protein [Desulfobacter sp.]|uniref:hypothetical protein n=1 Tax=Desulfobacter sp. TaxID=2294 RepID=UPI00257F41D1|nr:hypothetical protein [Desulfobacter sp.]
MKAVFLYELSKKVISKNWRDYRMISPNKQTNELGCKFRWRSICTGYLCVMPEVIMTDYEKYSLLIGGISSFVTLLAIGVAIWGERLRQWWIRPKLRISLSDAVGSLTKRADGKKGRYYSLNVINERLSSPASNVRVLLTDIKKKGPDDCWRSINFSAPVHITWKWPNITPAYATIGPDEMATFGYILESETQFFLQLYWCPNNLDPTFPPNEQAMPLT